MRWPMVILAALLRCDRPRRRRWLVRRPAPPARSRGSREAAPDAAASAGVTTTLAHRSRPWPRPRSSSLATGCSSWLRRRAALRGRERARRRAPGTAAMRRPTPRMQYTASSFAQPLTHVLQRAPAHARRRVAPERTLSRARRRSHSHARDVAARGALSSRSSRGGAGAFAAARGCSTGSVQLYILYIAVTLIVAAGLEAWDDMMTVIAGSILHGLLARWRRCCSA